MNVLHFIFDVASEQGGNVIAKELQDQTLSLNREDKIRLVEIKIIGNE
ncbi:MAG: hypothetical protein HGA97_12390 [Chlorobiaceae bacterium]|jgi:hypothetical protein|nr:hypothetical protein [Chlorobiaceae bacterium]